MQKKSLEPTAYCLIFNIFTQVNLYLLPFYYIELRYINNTVIMRHYIVMPFTGLNIGQIQCSRRQKKSIHQLFKDFPIHDSWISFKLLVYIMRHPRALCDITIFIFSCGQVDRVKYLWPDPVFCKFWH